MTFPITLIEALSSKICHDLISPVGAIHNGLELYEDMGGEGGGEVMALIAHSASQARARLKLFRLIYGAGGADSSLTPADIHQAFGDYLGSESRIAQNWDPAAILADGDLPCGYCKILAASLLLLTECMPKGGEISLASGPQSGETVLRAQGAEVRVRPGLQALLSGPPPSSGIEPKNAHAVITGLKAVHYGMRVAVTDGEEGNVLLTIS